MKQQRLFFILCLLVLFLIVDARDKRPLSDYQRETALLTAFKQTSVKSDPTNFLGNWKYGSGHAPCSWRGVSCSSDGTVIGLDLRNGGLNGTLNLKNLTALSLYLQGNFFFSSAGDSSSGCSLELVSVDFSSNNLSGELNSSPSNCNFLEKLSLSRNGLGGKIPGGGYWRDFKNLRHFTREQLFLRRDSTGAFSALPNARDPRSIRQQTHRPAPAIIHLLRLITKPGITHLYLPYNNISGSVPVSLTNCTNLRVLDLSSNEFTGEVPSGFPVLEKLLIASNYLSGSVPVELGECKSLKTIDLSFNALSGPIPREIWRLPNLTDLVMWGNDLTGGIPGSICVDGGKLETLILNNNLLTGSIPESISRCTNMLFISLSSNRFTGKIPVGFGNLERLAILQLGNNSLTGNVPPELGNCKSLVWLDLNRNHLTGNLPAELASQAGLVMPVRVSVKQLAYIRNEDGRGCRGAGGLFALEVVLVKRLRDSPMVQSCPKDRIYPVRYIFSSNGSMVYFDLSYNSVSGSIPLSYGDMEYLQILNLGHNLLSGTIPDSFWGLKEIGVLDSGITWRPLFPHRLGRLCGIPLSLCSSVSRPTGSHAHPKEQGIETGMIAGFVFSFMCVLILTVARYRVRKVKKKEKKRDKYIECLPTSGSSNNWKLSTASEPLSINVATFEKPLTYVDLLVATNGFGDVYKAQLADGSVVAVKKLNQFTGQGDRELMAEMETIGKIKYRNLVPLLDYCKIGEERLLVYEYMRHGSLETVLHRGEIFLDWTARKKIATGVLSCTIVAFLTLSTGT
ncbi:hypothetical protein HID58_044238 [Brassica napus]|uniref:non-specific serine/threonine protein kinase n=1 Tax=Brassica napus TaxID=3708 RepID=A0ABQ8BKG8_BRANA|nr:hypothetical protein HID58_044238 [Brassica napus]